MGPGSWYGAEKEAPLALPAGSDSAGWRCLEAVRHWRRLLARGTSSFKVPQLPTTVLRVGLHTEHRHW